MLAAAKATAAPVSFLTFMDNLLEKFRKCPVFSWVPRNRRTGAPLGNACYEPEDVTDSRLWRDAAKV
jgi:hypothetical protein